MSKLISSIIVAGAVLLTASATQAQAQTVCAARDGLVAQLDKKYQETPQAIGVTGSGGLVELLANKDGTTWTIIVSAVASNGEIHSCLLASGKDWNVLTPILTGPVI